jgi:phage terminase small subunit
MGKKTPQDPSKTPPKTAYQRLTDQQKLYVDAYVNPTGRRFNKTGAARAAGYSHPEAQGSRVYENVRVRAAIDEKLAEQAMAKTEVLARIDEQARGVPDDALDDQGRISIARLRELGLTHLIRRVKITERILPGLGKTLDDGKEMPATETKTEVEIESTQSALELLARAHGALTDRVEVNASEKGILMLPPKKKA